ncbi:hypothetical protein [Microbispora hainanensis]|uniref:ESX-1 secretion-associated protein n=1 Tax=Microbispora hainanensis TaxID=568844 RepID=A0A544YLQ2_9ACTN|nr:hypothetical protein [Microbispora hainanensis]TQS17711.1 hypothetical protein FLX08_28245 [Microbispora hainanensis]
MEPNLEIIHDRMRQDASRMRVHGEDYDAALRRLRERGLGGAAWQDDGLLGMLTGPYAECTLLGVEALTGLSATMADTGDGLGRVSARVGEAEGASLTRSRDLYGEQWA